MTVARTFDYELTNSSKHASDAPLPVEQLRMYVGGPGGTGKSRIIDAVKHLFKIRSKSAWLQCAAPTGTAAKAITGRTFFSMLGINPKAKAQPERRKTQRSTREDAAADLKQLKFIIFDEVSMIPCSVLHEISSRLIAINGANTNCDFGGVHVLFFGDFYQLTPCNGKPLYNSKAEVSEWDETIQGRKLWTRINKVFFLTQQHRQQQDQPFGDMLQRIRHGHVDCCCNGNRVVPTHCPRQPPCDYHALLSRVITTDVAKKLRTDADWKQCKVVVPQNLVRQALNIDGAVTFAMESKQPLLICTAIDRRAKSVPISKSDRARLAQLKDSQTASLTYRLPLVVGMRVMLRRNLATELGLTNGAEGTITKVILDPAESIPQALIDEASLGTHPVIYNLEYQPKRVVVHFDELDMPMAFSGMTDLNDVPIQPRIENFKWTHPTKKGSKDAKSWSIYRCQLPLIPTRAFTTHMAQGRTFGKFVADIHKDSSTSRATSNAVYVALSRGQLFQDLHILQWFHHSVLHCRPDPLLISEIKRLEIIEKRTVAEYNLLMGNSECIIPGTPALNRSKSIETSNDGHTKPQHTRFSKRLATQQS